MISKVSSVFDAALRTVSAALLLSSCLSFFRDLWSRRSLASLRDLSCGSKYNGRGRMDTKQKARSSSSVSRAGALVNPIFCTPDLERYTAR